MTRPWGTPAAVATTRRWSPARRLGWKPEASRADLLPVWPLQHPPTLVLHGARVMVSAKGSVTVVERVSLTLGVPV